MAFKERYEIDAAQAERALKALSDAQERVGKKAGEASEKLSAAEKSARRIAEMADPQKRYNRQMEELAVHVEKGRLSLGEAERAAATYQRRLEGVGKEADRSLGDKMVSNLVEVAGRWSGVALAVKAATDGVVDHFATVKKGQEAAKESRGFGALAQLAVTAGNTQAERQAAQRALENEALRYFADGAGRTPDEAAGLAFALNSASLPEADRAFLARAQAKNLIKDVPAFAAAIAATQSSFKINAEDVTSKSLAVAKVAPSQANEILQEVAKAGPGLASTGLGLDFGLAAEGILAKTFGAASEGATRLRAFVTSLEATAYKADPLLKGLGGDALLSRLDELGVDTDRATAERYLGGSAEAIAGAQVLMANRSLLRQLMGESDQADEQGLARQAIGLAELNPVFGAGRASLTASNRRELNSLLNSTLPNLMDATLEENRTYREKNYFGPVAAVMNGLETLGRNTFYPSIFGQQNLANGLEAQVNQGGLSPELVEQIGTAVKLLERVANASEATATAPPIPSAE